MIKIFIVDNEDLIVNCIQEMIRANPAIRFAGSAANGREALERIPAIKTGPGETLLVLMDLQMPVMGGFEASARLKELCPDIKVLILTGFGQKQNLLQGIREADGFISKNCGTEDILNAIERCARGEVIAIGDPEPPPEQLGIELFPVDPPKLSPAQIRVICLSAQGLTSKQIHEKMKIPERTVESLKYTAMDRLGIRGQGKAGLIMAVRKYKLCGP
jgi:DNA-binding NarL/FixJ family response regulator